MTRRLILVRHAKSSWDNYEDDHGRVLNKRGVASARAVGAWLLEHGYLPDVVLCSDAARTQETAQLMFGSWDSLPDIQLSRPLYHAAPDTIIDLVQKATADVLAVMGHNPGIGMAARMIVDTPPAHHRFADYPTCAVTIIDLTKGPALRGNCVDFTVPRDLIGVAGRDID